MKSTTLVKLAKIARRLENSNLVREADAIFNTLVRVGGLYTPSVPVTQEDYVMPMDKAMQDDLNNQDKNRMKMPRYNPQYQDDVKDEPDDHGSLEEQMHGNGNPGIANVYHDASSSLQQEGNGQHWGKEFEERGLDNAAGEGYKNLLPQSY